VAVAAGEGEQLADLPFVEFVPHGGQTLGQRPGVDEPVGRRSRHVPPLLDVVLEGRVGITVEPGIADHLQGLARGPERHAQVVERRLAGDKVGLLTGR
jgi:hypothetical protein